MYQVVLSDLLSSMLICSSTRVPCMGYQLGTQVEAERAVEVKDRTAWEIAGIAEVLDALEQKVEV